MFDSIQVRFKDVPHNQSPFANTRIVPFVDSYFEIIKSVIDEIKTEYYLLIEYIVNLSVYLFQT